MSKNSKWIIGLTILFIVVTVWELVPTISLITMSPDTKKELSKNDPEKLARLEANAINLGLDLKGGMHLIVEVKKDELPPEQADDARQRVLEVIRNRIDQFGVSEPVIQPQGEDRILIQLPGVSDQERAKEVIKQTAMLEFRLVEEPEKTMKVFNDIDNVLKKKLLRLKAVKQAASKEVTSPSEGSETDTTTERSGSVTETENSNDVNVSKDNEDELEKLFVGDEGGEGEAGAGVFEGDEDKPFTSLLAQYGSDFVIPEDNIPRVQKYLEDPDVKATIPEGDELVLGMNLEKVKAPNSPFRRYKLLMLIEKNAEFNGSNLTDARTTKSYQTMQTVVSLTFDSKAARKFSRFTAEHINRRLAIVLDGKVNSAPVIRTKIPDGHAQIEGNFTVEEASDLAICLRSGSLPAPIEIVEERTVGPTLGADSIRAGSYSAVMGLIIVLIFMIFYYKLSGLIANVALFLNMLFVLALLSMFHATLTLPGIAGLILTIGMAVDANVLIFQRIREESQTGKTVKATIDSGFSRAITTILDANITTLITAVILYYFGTGPIRGFAVTLSLGIICSLYTAILVSKLFFEMIYFGKPHKKISV